MARANIAPEIQARMMMMVPAAVCAITRSNSPPQVQANKSGLGGTMFFHCRAGGQGKRFASIRAVRLADFHQTIHILPARMHVLQRAVNLRLRDFLVWSLQHRRGFALGGLQYLAIADQVGDQETGQTRLARSEELSGTP